MATTAETISLPAVLKAGRTRCIASLVLCAAASAASVAFALLSVPAGGGREATALSDGAPVTVVRVRKETAAALLGKDPDTIINESIERHEGQTE